MKYKTMASFVSNRVLLRAFGLLSFISLLPLCLWMGKRKTARHPEQRDVINTGLDIDSDWFPFGSQQFHRCHFDSASSCSFPSLSDEDLQLIDQFIYPEKPLVEVHPFVCPQSNQPYLVTGTDGLVYCPIPKTGNTIIRSLLCSVSYPSEFPLTTKNGNAISKVYDWGTSKPCRLRRTFLVNGSNTASVNRRVVVVREPFERFVSGFTDKCLRSHDCPLHCFSVGCLLDHLETSLPKLSRAELNYVDVHFVPHAWQCNLLTSEKNRVVLQYARSERYYDSWVHLLNESNVDQDIVTQTKRFFQQSKTGHMTVGGSQRNRTDQTVLASPTLLRQLLRIYYVDYQRLRIPLNADLRRAINTHLSRENATGG